EVAPLASPAETIASGSAMSIALRTDVYSTSHPWGKAMLKIRPRRSPTPGHTYPQAYRHQPFAFSARKFHKSFRLPRRAISATLPYCDASDTVGPIGVRGSLMKLALITVIVAAL